MKNVFTATVLLALLVPAFQSCKKDSLSVNAAQDSTSVAVTAGTWIISSYTQKTDNNTSKFKDFVFTFSKNKQVNAVSKSETVIGTWDYNPPVAGYYGGPASVASFTLGMGASQPFIKLNKIWKVIEKTTTVLKLDNNEPLEDEHLVFTKK